MKNVTKMRIIHSVDSNPEKEYIKTFFNYIGLLVYDETIFTDEYSEWSGHLKKINDNDGVDVVLNYYGEDYYSYDGNRIYLYFDIKKKICKISTLPLSSPDVISWEYPILNKENFNNSKKNTRIKALDLLINEIWKDDVINRISIKKIRECYVSNNEDRDLFYVLQAIDCCDIVLNSSFVKRENIRAVECGETPIPTNLPLNDYTNKMFEELWRMECLLKQNNNPYAVYTKINSSELLLILYKRLYDTYKPKILSSIIYNGKRLELNSHSNLLFQMRMFQNEYPWFIREYFKLINYALVTDNEIEHIIDYLLDISKESRFPAYFSNVYNFKGKIIQNNCINNEYVKKKVIEWFKKAVIIDPLNHSVNFDLAYSEAAEGADHFLQAESIIEKIPSIRLLRKIYLDSDTNSDFLSFHDLLNIFISENLLSKIAIHSNREYSAKAFVKYTFFSATEFEEAKIIEEVADKSEKAYQDFIQYHKCSVPVYDLYLILKPWVENIIYDESTRNALRRKFDKWK